MSEQNETDNFENDTSDMKEQDLALSSKNNSIETESDAILEAEVEEKKSFIEKWRTSRFWLIKGTYYVLRSVWMTVMIIGGFIVWLISFLFI